MCIRDRPLAASGLAFFAVLAATQAQPSIKSLLAACLLAGIMPLLRPEMIFLSALLLLPLFAQWRLSLIHISCSNFSRLKPITVSAGPWKKDAKAVTKKIVTALKFPMTVKAANGHVTEFSQEVGDAKEMAAAIELAQGAGKKVTVEQVSCDFTKENYAAKPDLSAPGADEVPELSLIHI